MAERAAALAAETGLRLDVLGRAKCKALGMGIFMAVAEESEEEPKFIVLEHNAGGPIFPPWCWWARGSPSTPAASPSSRPRRCGR